MIIREWRARSRPPLAPAYREHFRAKVIPVLSQVSDFRGAYLTQRRQGEYVEFLVLTRWDSMHAIAPSQAPMSRRRSSNLPPRLYWSPTMPTCVTMRCWRTFPRR